MSRKHTLLDSKDWLVRHEQRRLSDNDVCITFDDNLLSQFDEAVPVLNKFGLTAFWFTYSSVYFGRDDQFEIYRYFRTTSFDTVDAFYAAFEETVAAEMGADVLARLASLEAKNFLIEFDFYSEGDRRFRFIRDVLLGAEPYERIMALMLVRSGFDKESARKRLYISEMQLRQLSNAGHIVGLHSFSHPTSIDKMDEQGQRQEYRENSAHLSQLLGSRPSVAAHPNGRYTAQTLAILTDLGISMAFRADCKGVQNRSELELPRIDHADAMRMFSAFS